METQAIRASIFGLNVRRDFWGELSEVCNPPAICCPSGPWQPPQTGLVMLESRSNPPCRKQAVIVQLSQPILRSDLWKPFDRTPSIQAWIKCLDDKCRSYEGHFRCRTSMIRRAKVCVSVFLVQSFVFTWTINWIESADLPPRYSWTTDLKCMWLLLLSIYFMYMYFWW